MYEVDRSFHNGFLVSLMGMLHYGPLWPNITLNHTFCNVTSFYGLWKKRRRKAALLQRPYMSAATNIDLLIKNQGK